MLRKERLTLHIRISAGDYCVLYFSYEEEMRIYCVSSLSYSRANQIRVIIETTNNNGICHLRRTRTRFTRKFCVSLFPCDSRKLRVKIFEKISKSEETNVCDISCVRMLSILNEIPKEKKNCRS